MTIVMDIATQFLGVGPGPRRELPGVSDISQIVYSLADHVGRDADGRQTTDFRRFASLLLEMESCPARPGDDWLRHRDIETAYPDTAVRRFGTEALMLAHRRHMFSRLVLCRDAARLRRAFDELQIALTTQWRPLGAPVSRVASASCSRVVVNLLRSLRRALDVYLGALRSPAAHH